MSGHSKWANIRVKKTAQDAKRGKVFTRHARLVEIAARAGGGDPSTNPTLRTAIENAKEDSVPNANIERAIQKGTGALKGEAMQEMTYEAYGPAGTAYIIQCLSDNRNRTIANLKMIIGRYGGRMAEGNAVAWMFERKGIVVAEVPQGTSIDDLELALIDVGAEDFAVEEQVIRVVTSLAGWAKVRDFLKQRGCVIDSAGLALVPQQKIPVTDASTAQKVTNFVEALEEDDDVAEVHTNAEVSADVAVAA